MYISICICIYIYMYIYIWIYIYTSLLTRLSYIFGVRRVSVRSVMSLFYRSLSIYIYVSFDTFVVHIWCTPRASVRSVLSVDTSLLQVSFHVYIRLSGHICRTHLAYAARLWGLFWVSIRLFYRSLSMYTCVSFDTFVKWKRRPNERDVLVKRDVYIWKIPGIET